MTAGTVITLTPEQFRLAGQRLAGKRKELGLTQEDLGRKAGYVQSAVASAERGRRRRSGQMPSIGLILTLASVLGTDLEELLAECGRCHGKPPAGGFICGLCGAESAAGAGAVTRKRGGGRGPFLPYREARRAAAWLREARDAAGLPNAAVGLLMGTSAQWVQARESGSTRLTAAEVEQIASALGVPVPDLTGGAG